MKKFCLLFALCFFLLSNTDPQPQIRSLSAKTGLTILKEAYPNEIKKVVFDYKLNDWAITMRTASGDEVRLFWAEGRLLPENELAQAFKYRVQFYPYPKQVINPATMDEDYIRKLKAHTSKEARRNSAVTSRCFFDTIYSADSRESVEQHLVKITFLNRTLTVHEKIEAPLKRVEKQIKEQQQENAEIRTFIQQITTCDCYHWREIRDSGSRSFHSYAIAIDILPKGWGNKIVYWNWERERNPNWMLVPIEKRWSPPQDVIDAFETKGFIWGGKWDIWDNMHFEYRPELFLFRKYGN